MGWKEIVAQVAPTIGVAFGGPLGGAAVSAVCTALGLPAGAKDADIEAVLNSNIESLTKIKEAEIAFQQRIAELGVDLEKIASEDRNSARQREVSTGDHTPRVLALVIVTGYCAMQYFILTHSIPTDMRDLVMRSFGLCDGALTMVLAYYFGSSASSARKNELLSGAKK